MKRILKKIEVPCNGCTLCCHGDLIRLEENETSQEYLTEPHPFITGALVLAHKHNGECVYLESNRCSIHDRTPVLCQIADCRVIAAKYDYENARRLHNMRLIDIRVWDQGRRLLEK
ncbi:MAG: hypothetical protein EHM64_04390 [Ignavibacteriae bacterium]|nr:MAG: hypothetical protein EHM64_04390 [Ignavibacteriota bacterium]